MKQENSKVTALVAALFAIIGILGVILGSSSLSVVEARESPGNAPWYVHMPMVAKAAGSVQLYGTFHAAGITVDIGPESDPDQTAVAHVEYREAGGTYRQGLPLSRISDSRFAGSLFWLEPDTVYEVRVTFSDPGGELDGAIFEGSGGTRPEVSIPPPLESLYTAPDGSGEACTEVEPCSLAEAIHQAEPGSEVVLRGGVYYTGGHILPHGTEEHPIVLRNYPGEMPILDGSDPQDLVWTDEGGGLWKTTANVGEVHLVVHDGMRLFEYNSVSNLQNLVWDAPGFYASDMDVYVHLENDADPNAESVSVTREKHGISLEDWNVIDGLTFRYYGQDYGRALSLNNDSNNVIQNCIFDTNYDSIVLKYGSHQNLIQYNEFVDTIYSRISWDAVYDGAAPKAGAIEFGSSAPPKGNVIRYNTIHGTFDGMHVSPYKFGKSKLSETDVYGNTIFDVADDAIQADGMGGNVRVWGNTMHNVLQGISFAPAEIGPAYAVRNLITNYRISAIKTGASDGYSGEIHLYHNTAVGAAGAYGIQLTKGRDQMWDLVRSRNNIWNGADSQALRNEAIDQAVDLDYDDLWNDGTADLIRWGDDYYDSLVEFASTTGQEQHGLNINPELDADYALRSTSPLVDAGVLIPGINDDYYGDAPDVGAFEQTSPARNSHRTTSPKWYLRNSRR